MVAKEGGGWGREELGAWISTGMVWLKKLKNKVKKSFFFKKLERQHENINACFFSKEQQKVILILCASIF